MKPQLRQHTRPLWLGLLAATLAPPLCLIGPWVAYRIACGDDSARYLLAVNATPFIVAAAISLVTALGVGLPCVLWLRARGWLDATAACACAAVAGATALPLLAGAFHLSPGLPVMGLGAAAGLVAGMAFSLAVGLRTSFHPLGPHPHADTP